MKRFAAAIALHDAIRHPLGVTPDSAVEFYDQQMADEAEERRHLQRAGGRHRYEPHQHHPQFCARCGYPASEMLVHLPDEGLKARGGGGAA